MDRGRDGWRKEERGIESGTGARVGRDRGGWEDGGMEDRGRDGALNQRRLLVALVSCSVDGGRVVGLGVLRGARAGLAGRVIHFAWEGPRIKGADTATFIAAPLSEREGLFPVQNNCRGEEKARSWSNGEDELCHVCSVNFAMLIQHFECQVLTLMVVVQQSRCGITVTRQDSHNGVPPTAEFPLFIGDRSRGTSPVLCTHIFGGQCLRTGRRWGMWSFRLPKAVQAILYWGIYLHIFNPKAFLDDHEPQHIGHFL